MRTKDNELMLKQYVELRRMFQRYNTPIRRLTKEMSTNGLICSEDKLKNLSYEYQRNLEAQKVIAEAMHKLTRIING